MHSARLSLKPICHADEALFVELYTNAGVMKYVYTPYSVAQAQAQFAERVKPWRYDSSDWLGFTLITKAEQKKIGTIGLRIIDHEAKTAEVGFMLHPDAQGRGYIPEALLLLREHAINSMQLTRLVAVCAKDNIGSAKVLQKAGFLLHKQLAANSEINGVLVDDLYFEWDLAAKTQQ